jgi:hypothetical protein
VKSKEQKEEYIQCQSYLSVSARVKKERLEAIAKEAGITASFQWPKENLDCVTAVRKKVEKLGYEKETYFTNVRPLFIEGRV